MTSTQYISVRETAQILGVSEKKIMDLVEQGKLQAYRIADQFLRLKKSEVLNLKTSGHVTAETVQFDYSRMERIKDFLYYYDFYILCTLFTIGLIFVIFYF